MLAQILTALVQALTMLAQALAALAQSEFWLVAKTAICAQGVYLL